MKSGGSRVSCLTRSGLAHRNRRCRDEEGSRVDPGHKWLYPTVAEQNFL